MRLIAAMLACLAAGIASAGDVADSADRIRPLLIGSTVPAVSISDVAGKSVALGAEVDKLARLGFAELRVSDKPLVEFRVFGAEIACFRHRQFELVFELCRIWLGGERFLRVR